MDHGFLRAPDGTITTFDPPGSTSTFVGGGGEPFAGPPINPAGVISRETTLTRAGWITAFLRAPDGTFTTFDAPGCRQWDQLRFLYHPGGGRRWISTLTRASWVTASCGLATAPSRPSISPARPHHRAPSGINPAGAITGYVLVTLFTVFHGFLGTPDGTFTAFNAPGSVNGGEPSGINPAGAITGSAADGSPGAYLQRPDGTFITFNPPGSRRGALASLAPSTRRARSRGSTLKQTSWLTATCGRPTAPSPHVRSTGLHINHIPQCHQPGRRHHGTFEDASGVPHGFVRIP